MINASVLNLEYLTRDTISSHPWNRPNEWQIDAYDSTWKLKPLSSEETEDGYGQMYVVKMCLMTCSADIVIAPECSMVIEGFIYEGGDPIPIIEFKNFDETINRASAIDFIAVNGVGEGASITKPFYKVELPFAQEILLWDSAGLDFSQGPPVPYRDTQGNVKLKYMTCRITGNQPYKNGQDEIVEMAWSRYFVDIYRDPGN